VPAHVPARDAIGWSSHPGARPSVLLRFVRMSSPAVSPFHRSICPRPSRRTTVRIVGGIVGEVRVAEAKWGFAATGATSALRSPRGDARLVELRNGSCVGLSLWQALAGGHGRYVVLVAHRSSGVSVVRAGGPWIVASCNLLASSQRNAVQHQFLPTKYTVAASQRRHTDRCSVISSCWAPPGPLGSPFQRERRVAQQLLVS